jgi:AraC family transcriptional regulator
MKIAPRIEKLREKKLVGLRLTMSVINNKTGQLWGDFGPRIKEITNRKSIDKISMQVYEKSYFDKFNPANEFDKWATVEVENFKSVPKNMETYILASGLYAVFSYKGSSSDNSIFNYIYSDWLPSSEYELADKPHFEVLGERYKNNDSNSEEEIWIPIKER